MKNLNRHMTSFNAADLAREVGDDGAIPNPNAIPANLRGLLDRYRIVPPTYLDSKSGFKGIALEEKNGSGRRLYAIAGADPTKFNDINAATASAKPQFESAAAKRMIRDATNHANAGGAVTITGHSLGGLLAQTIAYKVQQGNSDSQGGSVSLTTWSSLGGRELTDHVLQKEGKAFDPSIMSKIDSIGFYVDGDPLVRWGTHIEPTFAVPPRTGTVPSGPTLLETDRKIENQGAIGRHEISGFREAVNAAPDGLDSAVPKTPERNEAMTQILKNSLNPKNPMSEAIGMARNEAEPSRERQVADSRPAATTDLLVDPKALSLENKERLRDRLEFHAEEAERDPRKRVKVAKCMRDCFVEEKGFAGLPGNLPKQLGGIAATMSPVAALGILGDAVPEAKPIEVPRRRRLAADGTPVRPRRVEPEALDEAGQAAVRQAVLRIGPGKVQSDVARGAAKTAIQRIQGRDMMARNLPGVFGAAFGPVTGGADKPMRAAAKAANGINQRSGAPERADPSDAGGRESTAAIDRAVQAAGAEKFSEAFSEKLDEDKAGAGGFGLGGGRPSRAGQSLLEEI